MPRSHPILQRIGFNAARREIREQAREYSRSSLSGRRLDSDESRALYEKFMREFNEPHTKKES